VGESDAVGQQALGDLLMRGDRETVSSGRPFVESLGVVESDPTAGRCGSC
jgi:hypothetical protein